MAITHAAAVRSDLASKTLLDIDAQSNAGKLIIKDASNVVLVTLLLGAVAGTKPSGAVSGAVLTFANITTVNCTTAGTASKFDVSDGSGTVVLSGVVATTLPVTSAANNGQGEIRLTVTAHGYSTGDIITVASVGGTTEANGVWKITNITANTFDLGGSAFSNAYTSGGTATKGDIIFTNTSFAVNDPISITNGSFTYTAPV